MNYKVFNGIRIPFNADLYMVVDTETTSPAFVARIATEENARKNLAIAKPLIYDFGYVIMRRNGEILKRVNHLVAEVFGLPDLMQLAFYASKLPDYYKRLEEGTLDVLPWETIIAEFMEDASCCKAICAYNAAFDFKKAMPYTEKYLTAMTNPDFQQRYKFLSGQEWHCRMLATGQRKDSQNKDFLNPVLNFRGESFNIVDLWDVACKRLINIDKYRRFCIDRGLWTNSIEYFKTSAETAFQYLMSMYDFIEDHTALSDAEIEAAILAKALKKGKILPCIGSFPFRELGTTCDFVVEKSHKHIPILLEAYQEYLTSCLKQGKSNAWVTKIENKIFSLESCMK